MIDLETGLSIWSDRYSFTKAAADSVVYRQGDGGAGRAMKTQRRALAWGR